MKRAAGILLLLGLLLAGCSNARAQIDRAMALRAKLLSGSDCSFTAEITADYGDEIHAFTLKCRTDPEGDLAFTVLSPETISGITGILSSREGKLTFDDAALAFPLLADGQLAPVTAPWVFLNTLRSGYLTAAGMDGELLRLTIDDSYEEDALQLDIWLNEEDTPVHADILYDGRRILSMVVRDFRIS